MMLDCAHTTTGEQIMAKQTQYLVNGEETTYAVRNTQPCDYCGEPGCHWQRHSEARADVAAWDRTVQQELEPFGQHVGYSTRGEGGGPFEAFPE